MIAGSALAFAVVAVLLAAYAVVQVFRMAAAIRALSRAAFGGLVPRPTPTAAWPPPVGADANAVAQAALDHAPELFADARRQEAIIRAHDEAAPIRCPLCGGEGRPGGHREDCPIVNVGRVPDDAA